jgi:hypothetical protein
MFPIFRGPIQVFTARPAGAVRRGDWAGGKGAGHFTVSRHHEVTFLFHGWL